MNPRESPGRLSGGARSRCQRAITDDRSTLRDIAAEAVQVREGRLSLRNDRSRGRIYAEIVGLGGGRPIEAEAASARGDEGQRFSMHSFNAMFAEVVVHPISACSGCDVRSAPTVRAGSSIHGSPAAGVSGAWSAASAWR